jgi:dienelactone hydrolase
VLKAAYAYDAKAPLSVTADAPAEEGDITRTHLTFTDAKGKKVTGVFLRPKKEGVYPVVLVLHGLGGSKEQMLAAFGKPLVGNAGVAVLALDALLHGERKEEGRAPQDPVAFVDVMRTTVLDYRQALDWLAKRKDVDTKKVGLFGYSMGAMMGSILTGVDERVSAATLCVGGDPIRPMLSAAPPALRTLAEAAAPSNYIGHAAGRPLYLINGTQDKTITPEAAKRLIEAAKEPKTVVWVESGHILPADDVRKGLTWLAGKLGVTAPLAPSAAPAAGTR